MARAMFRVAAAALTLAAGCHLAIGLEPASELESTSSTTAMPDCTENTQCNDDNPCTTDLCQNGSCAYENVDITLPADAQTDADCKLAVCRDGMRVEDDDDDDVIVDGNTCTADSCASGQPVNPPLAGGTPCETGVCNGNGACMECFSDTECTAPDTCGGGNTDFACGCTPDTCVDLGLTCGNAPNGCVGALNCDTSSMDGSETDVDCGGPTSGCPRRCSDGQDCNGPSDCASNVCTSGSCVGN